MGVFSVLGVMQPSLASGRAPPCSFAIHLPRPPVNVLNIDVFLARTLHTSAASHIELRSNFFIFMKTKLGL